MRTHIGRLRPASAAVLAAALAVTVSACSSSKPSLEKCETVSAPLTDVPNRTDQEPRLRVPVPQGWERSTEMDSENIRFSIRNKGMIADGFIPNAVVTLHKVAGDLGKPAQILQAQQDQITKKLEVKDVTSTETKVCGAPALSSSYTTPEINIGPKMPKVPERKVTSLATIYRAGDSNYVASVTVQTVKPDDPGYVRDSQEILKGFQLLPPS